MPFSVSDGLRLVGELLLLIELMAVGVVLKASLAAGEKGRQTLVC